MKIPFPKNYQPPQGAKPGEPFEVVAVLTDDGEGAFILKTLDGVQIAGSTKPMDDDTGGEEYPVDPFALARLDQPENPKFI